MSLKYFADDVNARRNNIHNLQVAQKSKLSYFVHIFAKSSLNIDKFSQFFSPVDSVRNLLLIGMHNHTYILRRYTTLRPSGLDLTDQNGVVLLFNRSSS